jgi:hypothetical protein
MSTGKSLCPLLAQRLGVADLVDELVKVARDGRRSAKSTGDRERLARAWQAGLGPTDPDAASTHRHRQHGERPSHPTDIAPTTE